MRFTEPAPRFRMTSWINKTALCSGRPQSNREARNGAAPRKSAGYVPLLPRRPERDCRRDAQNAASIHFSSPYMCIERVSSKAKPSNDPDVSFGSRNLRHGRAAVATLADPSRGSDRLRSEKGQRRSYFASFGSKKVMRALL